MGSRAQNTGCSWSVDPLWSAGHGKASKNRTAAQGEYEAEAGNRPDGQCITTAGCRVPALCAFFRNSYYMGQELYKTKLSFKCLNCALCSEELPA